jgi:transposase InsO family protein
MDLVSPGLPPDPEILLAVEYARINEERWSTALALAPHLTTGVPDGFEIRTDHGPQYTGATCDEFSTDWNVDQTFAPVGRPTGNAVAETSWILMGPSVPPVSCV